MSISIGTQPIQPGMIMEAAQQAFMASGHQKDKIRAINKDWNTLKNSFETIENMYHGFKDFYTKKLRTLYTDSYLQAQAKYIKEATWKSKVDLQMQDLEQDHNEYIAAMHSETGSVYPTPTSISVPSGQLTKASSIETITNAIIAALLKSGNICQQANLATNNNAQDSGPTTKKKRWRQIKYYCYTHGANTSHASAKCKNPLGEHLNRPNATRCDPQGGSTKNVDKWNHWMHGLTIMKDKPN
mmetsp:Transcript_22142/g.46597  ORF Transcript_22142/g.46597 Transcript_22142/m.46597 type:complete len:242 (+) Transcript_22142:768-1493(+)